MATSAEKQHVLNTLVTHLLTQAEAEGEALSREEAIQSAKEYVKEQGGYNSVLAELEADDDDEDDDYEDDEDADDEDADDEDDDYEDDEDADYEDDEDLDEDEDEDDEDLDDDEDDEDLDDDEGLDDDGVAEDHIEKQKAAGFAFGRSQAAGYISGIEEYVANDPAAAGPGHASIEKIASMNRREASEEFEVQAVAKALLIHDTALALRREEYATAIEKRAARQNPELLRLGKEWVANVNNRALEILEEKGWDTLEMLNYIDSRVNS
jgi:hypothetical protein